MRVDHDELEHLLSGKKRITGVEITKDGELRVTFVVGEKSITLTGSAELGEAPTFARPWEKPGWLAEQFAEYGSLRAVGTAFALTERALKIMHAYAQNELGWRIQEGHELKRWAFIERYFAAADPSARPTLETVARPLGISQGHASQWKAEALSGKFFSSYFTLEKLLTIQNHSRLGARYVYFPGSALSPGDFALAQGEGWPTLPPGLVSDLLPRLSDWETKTIRAQHNRLHVALTHQDANLEFELTLTDEERPAPTEGAQLESIHMLEDRPGLRYFVLSGANVTGEVTRVLQASAGTRYKLR